MAGVRVWKEGHCVLIVHCSTETVLLNEGMRAGVPRPGAYCRCCPNSLLAQHGHSFYLPGG